MLNPKDFENISRIIFSSPFDKSDVKFTGRRIKNNNKNKNNKNNKEYMQFERIRNNQAFHENIPVTKLYDFFGDNMPKYKQADIFFADSTNSNGSHYMAFNKNGGVSFHKTREKQNQQDTDHNRRKNYIINEGDNIPVMTELGIFTQDFKIVSSMYGKFKQINRFTELFDDMSPKLDEIYRKYGGINIVDFGCGKSYLTFILYHYFISVKKFPENAVHMTGVDLKPSVIEKCNALAEKYGYKNLRFETGDIEKYTPETKIMPNVVVSLHGCDKATDYALFNAVKWQSDIIFAAPCCEHEINAQIKADAGASGFMRNFLKYGIVKERFSSLLTNSIRCNILETQNYKTELIEFVDIAHSPKNLLIRAVKSKANINKADMQNDIKNDIEETMRIFGISQTLYEMLK